MLEIVGMKHIDMDQRLADCLRFLSVDAINCANSGHPGMPLGMADVMTVLFREVLRHEPTVPNWSERDRVVLSNGHGSMLLYSALYLSGYQWDIDDLKRFRQYGSPACGHPEYDIERGVEATTGPLGQGLGMAVGMAAANWMRFEKDKDRPKVFCFVGDGCLMEGISHEACSLAPHLFSRGLIVLWDDNGISIDGSVDHCAERSVCQRFESYGFQVIQAVDAHNFAEIRAAFNQAVDADKPCLIQFKSVIGKGCESVEGSAKAHGQPLSQEALDQMRKDRQWPHLPFEIPDELRAAWDMRLRYANAKNKVDIAETIAGFDYTLLDQYAQDTLATRKASSLIINTYLKDQTGIVGGSADLAASNLTLIKQSETLNHSRVGAKNIAYGVREFAMFAIANGLSLSGYIPYVGTFLVFMDYGKSALRTAALMKKRVIYVLTHDSIAVGEDGPTHQPVEQLTTCRSMPNVRLWRPCGLWETAVAWEEALKREDGPTVMALSRQTLPPLDNKRIDEIRVGAYLLKKAKNPVVTIMASGSEVLLALAAADKIEDELESKVDVLSVPCWDLFDSIKNKQNLIRVASARVLVLEAGCSMAWRGYVTDVSQIVGVNDFGQSAPGPVVQENMGFHIDQVCEKLKQLIVE